MSVMLAARISVWKGARAKRVLVAVAAAVVGTALAFALVPGSDSGSKKGSRDQVVNSRPTPQSDQVVDSQPAPQGGQPVAPPGDPYGIGDQKMSLAQAQTIATFPVILPAADVANASQLTGVWVARYTSDDSQVALEFDEGAVSILENPLANPKPDAILARYQDVAATMNETIGRTVFSIVTVGTTPVLVAQPNSDGYKSNPASVELAIGSLDVVMTSHTYSVDQLFSVAESLLQPAA